MKESSIFVVTLCLLLMVNQSAAGQGKPIQTPISVRPEANHREQDGLNGPVRRVRVETANITTKEGAFVEGTRVLREVSTYDQKGKKIDSIAYPVEGNAPAGKEEYRYDQNGNISEMIVRGEDGTTLSRETYQYEMDEMNNWIKMTSSVAIYENGKVTFEPIEVTYRTIAYYYGQSIAKLGPANSRGSSSGNKLATTSKPGSEVKAVSMVTAKVENETKPASPEKEISNARIVPSPALNATSENKPAPQPAPSTEATGEKNSPPTPVNTASEKVTTKRVSEKELRDAAVSLPAADYSNVALTIPPSESKVEVHLIVGENGEVMNARAVSGHRLLIDAAETAARRATFSRKRLSQEPGQVYGTITYEFKPPIPEPDPLTANTSNAAKPKPVEASTPVSTAPSPVTSQIKVNSEAVPANSFYESGFIYLVEGKYADAVKAFEESARLNPNDAKTYLKLGLAFSAQNQYKEAIAALKMAIQIKPEVVDAQGYYHLGNAYAETGKHAKALEAFKQALYIIRAEAIDQARAGVKSQVPLDDVHLRIGVVYHNMRRHQQAIEALRQALELNPKLSTAYYVLSLSYLAAGNRIAAENQRMPLRSLDPALEEKLATMLSRRELQLPCRNVVGCR